MKFSREFINYSIHLTRFLHRYPSGFLFIISSTSIGMFSFGTKKKYLSTIKISGQCRERMYLFTSN